LNSFHHPQRLFRGRYIMCSDDLRSCFSRGERACQRPWQAFRRFLGACYLSDEPLSGRSDEQRALIRFKMPQTR
jgi:hypothetical protein